MIFNTKTFISIIICIGLASCSSTTTTNVICVNNFWLIRRTFGQKVKVRQWTVNQNSLSVDYRPLTFSLKIDEQYIKVDSKETAIGDSRWKDGVDAAQWPSWEIQATNPWNYGLICNIDHPEKSFTVFKKAFPKDNFPFTAEAVPIEIKAKGRRIPSWDIDQYELCAARLRISAFPPIQ